MKKGTKILALLLCAVLLVTASVAGTLAYLTSEQSVTNTFTVGNVTITLDEALVTEYGKPGKKEGTGENEKIVEITDGSTAARVEANVYKLIPGHTYTKDPTIHVDSTSEECYIFVKIVNEISAIEKTDATIASQMTADWTAVNGATGVYAKNAAAKAGDTIVVFNNFTIDGNADVSAYAGKSITVTAYAVQKDGFASAKEAWDATFGKPTT